MKNISKKLRSILGILISLILFSQQMLSTIPVNASDTNKGLEFIKEITLTDWDGNSLGTDVGLNSQVMLNCYFEIPEGVKVKEGYEYTVTIPEEIVLAGLKLDIVTDSEESIGSCTSDTNGQLKIKFNDSVSESSRVKGKILVKTRFDKDKLGDGGDKDLEFDLSYKKEIIHVSFHKEVSASTEPTVTKEGKYNEEKNEINWTVKVDCGSEKLSNVKLVDTLGEGQSFTSDPVKTSEEKAGDTVTVDGKKLVYDFKEEISGVETIVVTTKPDESIYSVNLKEKVISNDVDLIIGGNNPIHDSAEVNIPTDIFDKTGEYIGNGKVEWKIVIRNRDDSTSKVMMSDNILPNQKYVKGTLKYVDLNNNLIVDDDEKISMDNGSILECVDNVVTFIGVPDKKTLITFQTEITDEKIFEHNYEQYVSNNASLALGYGNGTGSAPKVVTAAGKVPVPSNLIDKRKGSEEYNPSTRELSWTVEVNRNEINLKNPFITDEIGEDQIFDADSIIIDGNVVELGDDSSCYYKDGILTCNLPSDSKRHVIDYKTKIKDNNVYANNVVNRKFENTATLNADNLEPCPDLGIQFINSTVIEKKGIYDYSSQRITWTILVNKNKMPIKGTQIVDDIPKSQKYIEGTFSSNYVDSNGEDKGVLDYKEADLEDDSKSGTLIYNFGDEDTEINSMYRIRFQTEIVDKSFFSDDKGEENLSKIVENTAQLKGDVVPENVTATGKCKVEVAPLSKTSEYKTNSDFIKWSILINRNSLNIGKATIVDRLNKYLKLDTSSIKLYKLQDRGNELPVKDKNSKEIEIDNSQIKYNYSKSNDSLFEFYFDDLQSAYLLEYTTFIDPAVLKDNISQIFNDAYFDGGIVTGKSSSTAENIFFIEGSASGTIDKGSIEINKVDKETNEPLKGAKFQLYDKFNNLVDEAVTDEDGKVKFTKVSYEIPYYVKEASAPEGYVLNEEDSRKFILHSDNKNIIESWGNKPIKGTVKVRKIDAEDGMIKLSGAVFKVYEDKDNDGVPDSNIPVNILKESSAEKGVYSAELKYGNYLLKEETAPEGYVKDNGYKKISIIENGSTQEVVNNVLTNSFENKKIKGSISLEKVDKDDYSKKLSGAIFKVYKDDGDGVFNIIKDLYYSTMKDLGNGDYKLNYLPYGVYWVKETEAPRGYKTNIDNSDSGGAYKVIIDKDGTENKVYNDSEDRVFTNTLIKGSVSVKKADVRNTDTKLSGAVFKVYNDSNGDGKYDSATDMYVTDLVEDENTGTYSKVLPYGAYLLKEEAAPEGFLVDEAYYPFRIKDDGEEVNLYNDITSGKFVNMPKKGKVELTKVDEEFPLIKLSGAEFKVYEDVNSNGKYDKGIDKYEGTLNEVKKGVYSKELYYGKYLLKEEKAPEGYYVDEAYYKFELNDKNKTVYISNKEGSNFINKKCKASLYILVEDKKTQEPIKGALIKVFDRDKNVIYEGNTDEEGKIAVKGLDYGLYSYEVKEVPDGYIIENINEEIDLNKDEEAIIKINKKEPSIEDNDENIDNDKDLDNNKEQIGEELGGDEELATEKISGTDKTILSKVSDVKAAIRTGDNSNIGILIGIAAASLIVILVIGISSKRKKKI